MTDYDLYILSSNTDFSQLFTGYNKIYLDIGCGHGDYLLSRCPEDSQVLWIGIDVSHKRISKTYHKLKKTNITNFRLFHTDAQTALSMMPAYSIEEININFPDPWLKTKQWKNRLFKSSFIADILRVLKSEGSLSFVTDIQEYAEHVVQQLELFPQWQSLYQPAIQVNLFKTFPTLFYRKMSPLRPISYLRFKKI